MDATGTYVEDISQIIDNKSPQNTSRDDLWDKLCSKYGEWFSSEPFNKACDILNVPPFPENELKQVV